MEKQTLIYVTGSENVDDADILIKAFNHIIRDLNKESLFIYSNGVMGVQSILEKHYTESKIPYKVVSLLDRENAISHTGESLLPRIGSGRLIQYSLHMYCDHSLFFGFNSDDIKTSRFMCNAIDDFRSIKVENYLRYSPIKVKKTSGVGETEEKSQAINTGFEGTLKGVITQQDLKQIVDEVYRDGLSMAEQDYIYEIKGRNKSSSLTGQSLRGASKYSYYNPEPKSMSTSSFRDYMIWGDISDPIQTPVHHGDPVQYEDIKKFTKD